MKNTLETKVDKLVKITTQTSKDVSDLKNTVQALSKTVEDLAIATARGFANTASKKDFEGLEKKFDVLSRDVNNSLENHTTDVRKDYDSLTSRVKKLETTTGV